MLKSEYLQRVYSQVVTRDPDQKEFHQAVGLTGLIVTKLDGSGKGGVVIAIQNELGLPTRFIGTGEKLGDIAPFDSRDFIANMV